jgi:hypothetical protein
VAWPAGAQVTLRSGTAATASIAPTATLTVVPISNGKQFNGTFVTFMSARVNVYSGEGPVMMSGPFPGMMVQSEVAAVTNSGQIANGTYSVQFFFTFAAEAPNVVIKNGDTVLAQCKLTDQQNWYSPERVCDSGQFEITNNRLATAVQLTSGNSALLTKIVINSYPPPLTER